MFTLSFIPARGAFRGDSLYAVKVKPGHGSGGSEWRLLRDAKAAHPFKSREAATAQVIALSTLFGVPLTVKAVSARRPNPASFHNISKSAFRRGEYVGHATGSWRIRKESGYWLAIPPHGVTKYKAFYAKNLGDVSAKLEEINAEIVAGLRKNPNGTAYRLFVA